MVEHVGPAALLRPEPPPLYPLDERVMVREIRVNRVGQLLVLLPEVTPFPFIAPELPPVGHPATVDFFFAATLHQFSFWTTAEGRYHLPLIAPIAGKSLKGSDYLWQAYLNRLADDPGYYAPARQADLTREDMSDLYRADDGTDPMPALDLHLEQAQGYGRDMLALGLTPQQVVSQARESPRPLDAFLRILDHVSGYKEDPLRKKPMLLAVILNQRPEGFLPFGPAEGSAPVIDYHVMRSCLRIGLIDVVDAELRGKLAERRVLSPAEEWAVRYACYRAVQHLAIHSGKSAGTLDSFLFFHARGTCPEMTEPECERCPLDPLCGHHKELFQPVLRTVFY
jgi:hypothetical protein